MRTLFLGLGLSVLAASCTPHFVMPGQLAVNWPKEAPPAPLAAAASGPTQGYLRVRATTNLDGLASSWSDNNARALFNKLLVSIKLNDGTLIPILDFDLTGASGVANNFSDIDVAKLMLVSLDNGKQAGDRSNPNFSMVIEAVPFTMANVVHSMVQFATSALKMLPPGADVATAFASSGTSQLISSVMDSVDKTAEQAGNRKWVRTMTTSVESALRSNGGVQSWILCPDDDNGDADPTLEQPPKTCKSPPRLVYCAGDGTTKGVLDHLCEATPGSNDPAHVYTDYAWVSLRFELLDTPGTDAIPEIDCNSLRDSSVINAWRAKQAAFSLKQADQDQLNWFVPKLVSYNEIVRSETSPAAQVAAFERWYAAVDSEPAVGKRTAWGDVYSRSESLDACMAQYTAGAAQAHIREIEAKQLYDTLKALSTLSKSDTQKIYDAIFTLGAIMVDVDTQGGDVSDIAKARATLEKKLFFFISDNVAPDKLACAVKKYPKCQFCQQQATGECQVAPPVQVAVGGDPSKPLKIEQNLKSAGFDTSALSQLRQIDQQVSTLDKRTKAKDVADLLIKRQEAGAQAADVLHKSLGITEHGARSFLLGN